MTDSREADYTVHTVTALECRYAAVPWDFARDQATAIARHWAAAVAARPQLFDGRVLMQTAGAVRRGGANGPVFRATYTDVSFSAFLAWRDFGRPVPGLRNGFGMAALRGSDGGFILGEMGAHTANAGRVYFPSGTPDLDDIVDEGVDIAGSIRRELAEETGLDPAGLAFGDGFTVVEDAHRVCFLQAVTAPEPADVLAARITATLAAQEMPELSAIHVVRRPADITPAMPPFVALYLRAALTGAAQPG